MSTSPILRIEHLTKVYGRGEAAVTAYLRAGGDWSAAVACGSAQASFSPAEAALNDGSAYTFTVLTSGLIVSIPNSFTPA